MPRPHANDKGRGLDDANLADSAYFLSIDERLERDREHRLHDCIWILSGRATYQRYQGGNEPSADIEQSLIRRIRQPFRRRVPKPKPVLTVEQEVERAREWRRRKRMQEALKGGVR